MLKRLVLVLLGAVVLLPCYGQDSVYVVSTQGAVTGYSVRKITMDSTTIRLDGTAIDVRTIRQIAFKYPPAQYLSARKARKSSVKATNAFISRNAGLITVNMTLPRAGTVDLAVYNSFGRKVTTLARGRAEAGAQMYLWNASSHGTKAATGVYVVRGLLDGRAIVNQTIVVK